jgi:uncharacterized UPF0160 family protein
MTPDESTPSAAKPILATHSGKFHCDEVFAYAVLRLALGLHAPGHEPGHDHVLLRTRKPELIATADIVWDVGSRYDAAACRFDHHQRGAPLREDGTPFSSAGLIWQVYGARAVAALLPNDTELVAGIAAELDRTMVHRIDEIDNGVSANGPLTHDGLALPALVGDFNPSWDEPDSSSANAGDAAFLDATRFVGDVLRQRVNNLRARASAEALVMAAYRSAEDPRILVLERGMPWKNVVFHYTLPVLFAVSPASNGNWMLDTIPVEPGSFTPRLPLPEAWAGLEATSLAQQTGVEDAVFVHLRRFVGAAKTKAGAVAMARGALEASRGAIIPDVA